MAWWCMIIIRSCMMMCDAVWCTVQIQRLEFGLMALWRLRWRWCAAWKTATCHPAPWPVASMPQIQILSGSEAESRRVKRVKGDVKKRSQYKIWLTSHIDTHRHTSTHVITSTHIDKDGISQFTPSRNHKIWEKQGKCKPENNTTRKPENNKLNNRKPENKNTSCCCSNDAKVRLQSCTVPEADPCLWRETRKSGKVGKGRKVQPRPHLQPVWGKVGRWGKSWCGCRWDSLERDVVLVFRFSFWWFFGLFWCVAWRHQKRRETRKRKPLKLTSLGIFGNKKNAAQRCISWGVSIPLTVAFKSPVLSQPANIRQPFDTEVWNVLRDFKEFMTFDLRFIFFWLLQCIQKKWRNKMHQNTCKVLQKFNSRFSKAWHKLRSAMSTSLRGPSDCGPMSSRKHHAATIDLDVRLSTWRVLAVLVLNF